MKKAREHLVSVTVIEGVPYDMWPNTFVECVRGRSDYEFGAEPNFEGAYCPYPRQYASSKWFCVRVAR